LETTSKQAWHNGHNIGGSRTLKYEPILPVLWWCQSQAWRKEEEGDVNFLQLWGCPYYLFFYSLPAFTAFG